MRHDIRFDTQTPAAVTRGAAPARATATPTEYGVTPLQDPSEPAACISPLASRVRAEYREMPGLRLTVRQAARLFGIAPEDAATVLDELWRASFLTCSDDGTYGAVGDLSRARVS